MPIEFFKKVSEAEKARRREQQINAANRHGTNLFFQAIESNKLEEVAKLFREGADLNARTTQRGLLGNTAMDYSTGATPLHAAALLGNTEVVAFLLEKGANPRAKDDDGHTPLDYAILGHRYNEAILQRKEGSMFSLTSTVNKAASKVGKYEEIITQLQGHGAKPGMFALPDRFRRDNPDGPGSFNAPPMP
ncbi:MAG: ankyrin repeat domain-containing protein [Alphaproteobacteria bacterium]